MAASLGPLSSRCTQAAAWLDIAHFFLPVHALLLCAHGNTVMHRGRRDRWMNGVEKVSERFVKKTPLRNTISSNVATHSLFKRSSESHKVSFFLRLEYGSDLADHEYCGLVPEWKVQLIFDHNRYTHTGSSLRWLLADTYDAPALPQDGE